MDVKIDTINHKLRKRMVIEGIFAFSTLLLAAAIVIIASIGSFTGLTSSSIALGACTNTYYSKKYSSIGNMLSVFYFLSIFSILAQVFLCILLIPPVITKVQPAASRLYSAYFLSCAQLLSAITGFGHFLTFYFDFSALDSNCTISSPTIVLVVLLGVTAANLLTSFLQWAAGIATATTQFEEEKEEAYRTVVNMTNNTLQSIQQSKQPRRNLLLNQQQSMNLMSKDSKLQPVRQQQNRYQSQNQLVKRLNESQQRAKHQSEGGTFDKKDSFPIKPGFHQFSSISEEESFNSLMKEQKLILGKLANRPGPILAANLTQQDKIQSSQGYARKGKFQGQKLGTADELIAVIRGKYSNK